VKTEHVEIGSLVHRMVTSSNGLMNVSCDLTVVDADDLRDGALRMTDARLTCVPCLVADWRAVTYRLYVKTGRMSSEKPNL
jgi:hypothetical protein